MGVGGRTGTFFSLCLWNIEYNRTGVMNMKRSLPRVLMNRLQCVTNQGKHCYSNGGRASYTFPFLSMQQTQFLFLLCDFFLFVCFFLEHSF